MPEYSSTTITPADSVKVPAMNGGSSGNFQLDALRNFILASKGLANGLASLDGNGKLPTSQLPDLADDVLVYGSYPLLPSPGIAGKLYITADNNRMYRWNDALATPAYVDLSVDLSDYALISEIMDGTIQAGVAVQAWQDILGNAIITTYATKTEANDLKNALSSVDHRVQNLESAKGDYVPVDSDKGVITTPSGKGKWAVVEKLRGVSRAENQLVRNGTFNGTTDWNTYANSGSVTISASSNVGIGTCSGAVTLPRFQGTSTAINSGHTYLLSARVKASVACSYIYFNLFSAGPSACNTYTSNTSANQWYTITGLYTHNANATLAPRVYFDGTFENGDTINATDVICKDLTLYFGSTVPTLAEIQNYYPWLLSPSDYGTSLVDSVYEVIRSKSRNLFDRASATVGKYYDSNGNLYDNSNLGVSDYIPVTPSVTYYLKSVAVVDQYQLHWFDGSKNWIGRNFGSVSNTSINAPDGASYVRVNFQLSDSQVCFNKSDSLDGTFTPYFESTLSLPTPITLRSAGTVAEEFDLETGEKTNPLGSYTFTGNESWTTYSSTSKRTDIANLGAKNVGASIVPNLINDMGLVSTSRNAITSSGGITVSVTTIIISNDSVALATAGKKIYFELETPNAPTQLDPIQNPTILTEAGGTITAQTEEPIDGNFSVGFITL